MEGSSEKSCIFSDIVEGKAPRYKVYEDGGILWHS